MIASPTTRKSIRDASGVAVEVGIRRANAARPILITNEATGESIVIHATLPADVSGLKAWKEGICAEHNIAIGDLTWAKA